MSTFFRLCVNFVPADAQTSRDFLMICSISTPPIPVVSEVKATGFWIGGWPDKETITTLVPSPPSSLRPWDAIIDLTAELPLQDTEVSPDKYKCCPTLDATPVALHHLNEAATFSLAHRTNQGGNILVHCAFGKGRSTMTLCACLVAVGLCNCWEEAYEIVKKHRSIVNLSSDFQDALEIWEREWRASKAKESNDVEEDDCATLLK